MKGTPEFPQCGFSGQAVAALNAIGKPYAYVNIFEDPEIREGLKEYSNWPTFPQLYVKGELIGGSDIVIEMYNSGELREKLRQFEQHVRVLAHGADNHHNLVAVLVSTNRLPRGIEDLFAVGHARSAEFLHDQ